MRYITTVVFVIERFVFNESNKYYVLEITAQCLKMKYDGHQNSRSKKYSSLSFFIWSAFPRLILVLQLFASKKDKSKQTKHQRTLTLQVFR